MNRSKTITTENITDNANETHKTPVVTVGVPVYNGELTIRDALLSILNQTYQNVEVIISDNASTDRTSDICRELAAQDKRIHYVRQPSNRGATFNFNYVLDHACGEYFMWAACDDKRSLDFIEVNCAFLAGHEDYVASTSPARFTGGVFNERKMGDSSLVGTPSDRFKTFFSGWHANGRFYSLMRTRILKTCPFTDQHYMASDWTVVLFLASLGKINCAQKGWVELGRDGVSRSKKAISIFQSSPLDVIVPFHHLWKDVSQMASGYTLEAKTWILWAMVKLNLVALAMQVVLKLRRQ
ncbi:MAG: glycosyltransferase family 2 protein [Verrucomicrobia bacterium]|jgi:glycosyltransferase involved in cell wall biosynthesis|nr:glycosyltransferase family 2 protein [Verrucomicrobiota bacterium]MBT7065981.1 glycosyltransferase family 2 protein [Verrucomicrobiota bacterium]MBT7699285.1 glycosyltransferase family 2 protein [Verrucomicrobiota bacterium]